jgi:dipeptidyl aminopeptidase/acylaminoacyl peptidase
MRFVKPTRVSPRARRFALAALLLLASTVVALAQGNSYRKPPQEVLDVLNAPITPTAFISPTRDRVLLATGVRYPSIADLAQPMLRLAGLRINPNTSGPHRAQYFVAYTLKRVSDGAETKVILPTGTHLSAPEWSADGKHFAFTNTTPAGIELWTGDTATGRVARLRGLLVNAIYGDAVQWMPDSRTLVVQLVPAVRPKLLPQPSVPVGPNIQESYGKGAPVPTYEDLLKTTYDEDLFEHYAAAQLAFVDALSGHATNVGQPAIYETARPSPDGRFLLVARVHRPFS